MSWPEAAEDIALDAYADRIDSERIAANVATLYREFSDGREKRDAPELFAVMGRYRRARGG